MRLAVAVRRLVLLALLTVGVVRPVRGQELHGVVRDIATRQPIAGAVLTLLDSSGAVLGRMLTTERGEYRVDRAGPTRTMRVQRLGFRLRQVPVVAGEPILDVAMESLPSLLDPVKVVAAPRCPRRPDESRAFALLEQVRAALLTTVVARESNPGKIVRLSFERRMYGATDRIISQSVRIDSSRRSSVSFRASRSGGEFARRGFLSEAGDSQIFLGPDAESLLDDKFASNYCFRIMDRDPARPNQIGLGFTATERKKDRIDIDGALWVDTLARALRDIDYRFVGLNRDAESIQPGGKTFFREMPNGVVLIDRWVMRLPNMETDTVSDSRGNLRPRRMFAAAESGGETARASWPDGVIWRASLGSIRVRAQLPGQRPSPGTIVRLDDTDYRAVTDSNGYATMRDLVPGPYSLSVVDPRLAELDLSRSSALTFTAVRDSTVERTLEVPATADYVADRCARDRNSASRATSLGSLILGRVMTSAGNPVKDAEVKFAEDVEKQPFASYKTGSDGVFQLCLGESRRMPALTMRVHVGKGAEVSVTRPLTDKVTTVRIVVDPMTKD